MHHKSTCSIDGCNRPHYARGYCVLHDRRVRKHGNPYYPRSTFVDRLLTRIEYPIGDGCWSWAGAHDRDGYGLIWIAKNNRRVHRITYELYVDVIPAEQQIDHLCRNPGCVNPSHMEVVTPRENTLRGMGPSAQNAQKTHCHRGHEFTPQNTGHTPDGKRRYCRECKRIDKRSYRERRAS